jgi:xylulose-5-phosphate/fructose-6-phosphate phosphoketolase
MDTILSKQGLVARCYLPPDANCLLAVAEHCLQSSNYVNLIIIDKQPQLQYLSLAEARQHCKEGVSVWKWASNDSEGETDIVMACCGDIPTMETLAAVSWLRKKAPTLRIRTVNVVDALSLYRPERHPHGIKNERFSEIFTADTEVMFAFHGYPGAVHMLLHGRPRADRFHVRGYNEAGTTTTPFDMVVLNKVSRFHLVKDGLKRLDIKKLTARGAAVPDVAKLTAECDEWLKRHHEYSTTQFDDIPEIKEWVWEGEQH